MEEEKKKQVATFRFKVIADLVGGVCLPNKELQTLIKEKAKRQWEIPFSDRKTISANTIRRWINHYEEGSCDIKTLYPKDRDDRGGSRAIDSETGASLLQIRTELPDLGVPGILYEMEKRKIIKRVNEIKRSTVYRFFHQNGGLKKKAAKVDRRRFEAEFPNDIWQTDVMHGPKVKIDNGWKKTYLIAFIDDHSRLIPHATFYLDEGVKTFLKALKVAFLTRGLPRKLYTDNGSAFRSKHLDYALASLQIVLWHAKPYTPQGKGKIERFFKTVRGSFLAGGVSQDLIELNEQFSVWLHQRYHLATHSSTGEKPLSRFTKNIELIRAAPENIDDHFRKVEIRKVTKDRVVHLDGRLYQAPIDLIAERVEIVFHPDNYDNVEVRFKGKSYGFLESLDLGVNVKVRREKTGEEVALTQVENVGEETPCKDGDLFSDLPEDLLNPPDDEEDIDLSIF